MAKSRDRHDETLDEEFHPDGPGDGRHGGTIDDSVPDDSVPDSVEAGSSTSDSGDLGIDLEAMRRLWGGSVEASGTSTGMTIKVDMLPSSGTLDDSAEAFGTVGDSVETRDPDPSHANLDTIADLDAVSGSADATLADSAEFAEALRGADVDATIAESTDDEDEEMAAQPGATLPDDAAARVDATISDDPDAAPRDIDETFVVEDRDDLDATISSEDIEEGRAAGATLPDDPEATVARDVDRTYVLDEGESDEGQQTLPDDPSAVAEPGGDADRTFVLDDADDSGESGSFTDPQTINVDQQTAGTINDAGQRRAEADPDTWQPQHVGRTAFGGEGASRTASDGASLGADVGITVRPRSFATGEANPDFGADYEILRTLGQGGMGVVFEARQASIDREVAVKMLKPPKKGKKTLSPSKLATQRTKFLAEAVVTGDLDHPNIVPVYDLGTDDSGSVFYSMKRVSGTPWEKVVGKNALHENLTIFMRVADAVAFAHNRGVVHRDLKPENVMLGDFGEVLLMDWGLALTNDTFRKAGMATKTGSIGGTPSYMAPEMAAGDITKVGTHSDVYLLGAILYEIVTGHPPHSGRDVMKCLYAAAKNEIVPTDRTGELVDVALKAMSTKRRHRYASVAAMQDAIRDYQSHSESIAMSLRAAEDLVEARKSDDYEDYAKAMYGFQEAHELWEGNARAERGISESRLAYAKSAMAKGDLDLASTLLHSDDPKHAETRRAIVAAQQDRERRKRQAAMMKWGLVATAAAILLIVSGAAVWINKERNEAVTQRALAVTARDEAVDAKKRAEDAAIRESAAKDREATAKDEALAQRDRAEASAFDSWASQQFAELARNDADAARVVAVDAQVAATAAQVQEAIQRRDAEKQRERARVQELEALFSGYTAELEKEAAEHATSVAEVERLAADFSRKQEEVAKVEAVLAKEDAVESEAIAVRAKEAEEYESYVAQIGLASAKIRENEFESARQLLEECKPALRNWEWGRLMHLCSQSHRDFEATGPVDAIAISPKGDLIAAGTWTGDIIVWERESGREFQRLHDGGLYVNALAFSPDGTKLASGSSDDGEFVKLWDVADGRRLDVAFEGHTDAVLSVAFDAAGERLLTSSYDNTARLWNADDGEELQVLRGHNWWVWTAAFDPTNEDRIVTASQDGTVGVWQVGLDSMVTQFTGHRGPVFAAAVSPDGTRVVSGGYDKQLLVWEPKTVKPFDFRALAEGETPEPPKFRSLPGHDGAIRSVRFAKNDGAEEVVVTGGHDNTVRVWDLAARPGEEQVEVFRGHDGWVRSAAFSPDGTWVVSGSQDEFVKLWSIDGYEEIRVLRGRVFDDHGDAVLAADFSRDGDRVVTASRDRTARTYDVATGAVEHVLQEGHSFLASSSVFLEKSGRMATSAADNTTRVWDVRNGTEIAKLARTGRSAAIATSRDGGRLVTGGDALVGERNGDERKEWTAQIWDGNTFERLHQLTGHTAEVTAVAISADGTLVYTGDAKGYGRLWDGTTGQLLFALTGHTERINGAAFLSDGSRLLTASNDYLVTQWDTETGRERTDLVLKHGSEVRAMALVPGDERVVTSDDDGRLRIWNVAGGESIGSLGTNNGFVSGIDVSPDGSKVVTTHSSANVVKVWDLETRKEIPIVTDVGPGSFLDWSNRRTPIWSARFSPDGNAVLTVGGADARLWNLRTGEEQLSFSPHGAVAAAGFSPDGKLLVTGSWDFSAKIWSAETGRAIRKLAGAHDGYVNSARFSPDGLFVLTASDDGTAKLWDPATGEVVRTFAGHSAAVMRGEFSADGTRILTASADGTARIWNTETGEQTAQTGNNPWGLLSAAFSVDGRWIVTGGEDNAARIWELTEDGPQQRFVLAGHTAAVTSVAFSPDHSRVLTGSRDDTVKLWDSGTGKEILTLDGHSEPVTAVTFSPDGRYALTASRDGRAILWLASEWKQPEVVATTEE